ncbi:TetR/AcrR family transcriptional regulator [Streptomyces lydicus]|uniref:TetR/AcrR family transcriptional regulator n=1 Tax=Streptomyces lydicus TaxID=47763 RepID=UPI00379661A6
MPLSNPERRREVFDVVLELLAEVGYERFSMDLVARRARASKATLYQRWPSKAELVVDALEEHQPVVSGPDTGSLPGDLRELLAGWLAGWDARDRGLMLALLEGSRRDEELARLREERLGSPIRQAAEAALARARRRGEITGRIDAELLLELPFALVLLRVLVRDERPGRELVDRIVDGIVAPLLGTTGPPE